MKKLVISLAVLAVLVGAGFAAYRLGWFGRTAGSDAPGASPVATGQPGSTEPAATPGVAPAGGDAQPSHYPSEPASYTMARGSAPESYEDASSRLSTALTLAQDLVGAVDPALVDVAERAKGFNGSVDAAFTWVRDSVRFEPYAGLLRGARGALIAGAANSLDRSLLLAESLRKGGHTVRIASGTLSDARLEELLAAWARQEPAASAGPGGEAVKALLERTGGAEDVAGIQQLVAHQEKVRQWIRERAQADVAGLRDVLGAEGEWFTDAAWSRMREAGRSHYWVQVKRDSEWVDLDPSFPASTIGQRYADASSTFDPDRPPAAIVHSVTFTVTAERGDAKSRSTERLLQATVAARDLVVDQIRLSTTAAEPVAPGLLHKVNKFRPSLQVGSRRINGSEFQLIRKADMPDISSSLFGAETPPAGELTALWLDIALARPGAPPRVERRYFVDRIGASARAGGEVRLAPIPAERMPYLVLREYDVLVMPAPHPEYLSAWLGCRQVVANRKLLEQAVAVRFGRAAPASLSPLVAKSGPMSPVLLGLADGVSRELEQSREGARLVLSEPFVAMVKHGFSPRSALEDPLGLARLEEGIDIVGTGITPAGGSPAARAALGLLYGTSLTNLELAVARSMAAPDQPPPSNASVSFEQSRAKKLRAVAVRQAADEAATGFSGDRLAVLRAQREQGYVLVANAPSPSGPDLASDSWWRLDPASGVVLGVRETGEGQALTEDQQLVFVIAGMGWCQVKSWANSQNRKAAGKDWGEAFYYTGQVYCIALGALGYAGVLGAGLGWAIFAFVLGIGGDCIGLY